MILIDLDQDSGVPIYRQIVDGIVERVERGGLAVGDRLPPTRVLAGRLGVNRSTVLRAYQELWALGYVESRPGSYSTVRRRVPLVRGDGAAPAASPAVDWPAACTPKAAAAHADLLRHRITPPAGPDGLDMASLAADRELAPTDAFRRVVDRVLRTEGRAVLDYGSPQGHFGLREVIAQRMQTHGVRVDAGEIMVTNGAQHALGLLSSLLVSPGDAVVVESPTYSAALPLLRLAGARLVEVPMTDEGMDLDALDDALDRERPAFVYTMPTFQNPTGITMPQPRRERLLAACERTGVPLVEDGFEEEMKYFGRAVLPVKSMDERGAVVYVGTFSKVVFPGLRVGWIAAPEGCIERLVALNRFASLSTTTLGQAALARFCRDGGFEPHLRRLHTAYRRRMAALLDAFEKHMPAHGVRYTRPTGGYTAWISAPGARTDEQEIVRRLAAAGVSVAPGSLFFAGSPAAPCFRISVCNLTEPQVREGVRRIAAVLAAVLEG